MTVLLINLRVVNEMQVQNLLYHLQPSWKVLSRSKCIILWQFQHNFCTETNAWPWQYWIKSILSLEYDAVAHCCIKFCLLNLRAIIFPGLSFWMRRFTNTLTVLDSFNKCYLSSEHKFIQTWYSVKKGIFHSILWTKICSKSKKK